MKIPRHEIFPFNFHFTSALESDVMSIKQEKTQDQERKPIPGTARVNRLGFISVLPLLAVSHLMLHSFSVLSLLISIIKAAETDYSLAN